MQKIYAGIGSRNTPPAILAVMQKLGKMSAKDGWLLRSGNCIGADQAFQCGANQVNAGLVELFLPWPSYETQHIRLGNAVYTPSSRAYAVVAKYHPAWHRCNAAARAMHARNVQIVLGAELDEPVELVVCWTPKGQLTGGTAMGIRVAMAYNIPVYNLAKSCGLEPVYAQYTRQMCFEF